jgi:HMG (high mobility group) box
VFLQSAYLLYQNAMRDQFKAINPGMTFGQLAKYTSAMYAELPPSEKESWVARAEADKARYLHDLAMYAPPPGFDPKGDAIINPIIDKSGRRGKPEKDANAPKRNMSAYLLYQNAMRDQFKRENPGMTFGQLAKYTSHMYKNLTAEEKETWQNRAQQDKTRYDAEICE